MPNLAEQFLDLWTRIGRVSAAAALASPLCAELDASLLALGYPGATVSAGALGSTLGRLSRRGDVLGRRLARWHGARGNVWYVLPA